MNKVRNIPDTMDINVVKAIDERLCDVEKNESVKILWAIESGSRAWGFPSPDSDYDCRFIYKRSMEDCILLWPKRDVIETPLDHIFDVNGWDLSKALKLFSTGNAVIIEWIQSPIIYSGNPEFKNEFLSLIHKIFDKRKIAYHYYYLGQKGLSELKGRDIRLKKLFYLLRPALALRWLMENDDAVLPMNFLTLLEQTTIESKYTKIIMQLLAEKAITKEMGKGPIPSEIINFLEDSFKNAKKELLLDSESNDVGQEDKKQMIESFYRKWIENTP